MDPSPIVTATDFNVVLNGGAFGVLVFLAIFLMKNIPKWINDHLDTVKKLAETHKEEAKDQQVMFASQLAAERAMCDRHHENVLLKLEQSNNTTLAAFTSIEKSIDKHHEFAVATMMSLKEQAKQS